jgi:hypothetical protein
MSGSRRHLWAKQGGRAGALALSLGAHGAVFTALVLAWATPPAPPEPAPIAVTLIAPPPPPPPPPPPAPPTPAKVIAPEASASRAAAPSPPAPPTPVRAVARPTHAAPTIDSLIAATAPRTGPASAGLSDAQYAGAASADAGGDGGEGQGCHMAQRVQAALRRDALVQAAVSQAGAAGSRAIMVWNGDWVQNGVEDGKGLAAVREAIVWEVGFAPPACRAEHMHGLVLLSLNGAATRLAVGAGEWRWSDLLTR